jgi:hypothetical protein
MGRKKASFLKIYYFHALTEPLKQYFTHILKMVLNLFLKDIRII